MLFRKKENAASEENFKDLPATLEIIKNKLSSNVDVIFREITVNPEYDLKVTLAFTEGVVDQAKLSEYVLRPIVTGDAFRRCKNTRDLIKKFDEGAIYYGFQKKQTNAEDAIKGILSGGAAIIVDKPATVITFEIQGFSRRQVSEPTGENIVKGGKDTLVEYIRTNTATLRARIKSPDLKIKDFVVGKRSQTKVAVIYISSITNSGFVKELEKRISNISIDNVQTINQIEESIIDTPYALFPQFMTSERPDTICSDIVEGRVCILIDGTPLALIAPATIASSMRGAEDYAQNAFVMTLITILRYFMLGISFIMPGLFVAVETFQPEMFPTEFIVSLASARQGVPFTAFIEALILLVAYEVLLEAGLRLPKVTGQAISIVGGVIVGQAAIQAKIISPGILIAVSMPIIASFALPNRDMVNALRVWRLIFIFLGGFAGMFGMQLGLIWFIFSLARIEALGVPYLSPFAGMDATNFKDIIIRAPYPRQSYRPKDLKTKDKKRQKNV